MPRLSRLPYGLACTLLVAAALMLQACSPALNWRSVAVPEAGLTLSLPCKPERATRPVDLEGAMVDLTLVGCEADGATFAVSHMLLADPSQAGATLARWRAAMRARMRGGDELGADEAFVPAHALALPQSVRMTAQGTGPDGSPVVAHAVWFARLEGGQARLYHAVIYARALRTAVADTFFAGLVLQP